jgi:hypothetical protein
MRWTSEKVFWIWTIRRLGRLKMIAPALTGCRLA